MSAVILNEPKPDPVQPQSTAVFDHSYQSKRGLLSLFVSQSGAGVAKTAVELITRCEPELVHVDLCLDDPGIDTAVEELHARGFFYCGLLPEFARTDVLRMQYLAQSNSRVLAPDLENPGAQQLLTFIRADS